MDITKQFGDIKYKEMNTTSNVRVYFDPVKYFVEEEPKTRSDTPADASIKLQL